MRFKRFQRFLAQACGLCLAAVAAAAPAWAAGASPASPDSPDPYALAAPVTGAPLLAAPREGNSGDCGAQGNNLTWTLDSEGTLTITGSGAMADYMLGGAPWSTGIKRLVLPENLTSIGGGAFYFCSDLTSVELPDSLKSIGDYAFYDCTRLTSVSFPDSLKSIGGGAFEKCSNLTSVEFPASLKSIGESAFNGCSSLAAVSISAGVEAIGGGAFNGCTALTAENFAIDSNNPYFSLQENGLLLGGGGKELIALLFPPGGGGYAIDVPAGVETIGFRAFSGCSGLTAVEFPDSLKSIAQNAFSGCSGLTSVEFPASLTSIGYSAFSKSGLIGDLTLPEGVETIGFYAFEGCSGLTAVSLPASLTSIGDSAFNGCTALASINFTSPASLTSIGDYAFYNCSGLTSVTLPEGVEAIGGGAFYGCSGLTSVDLPASLTSVGAQAFEGCERLKTVVYNGTGRLADLCGGGLEDAGFGASLTFRYAVAVENGGTGASDAGVYTPGDPVALTAGTREHYTFDGWTVTGVTLTEAQLKAPELTFTMPDGPVTASANWALPSASGVSQTGSTVKLTFPGAAPADGAKVLAALDGTDALSGTYDAAGSEVRFQRPLEKGRKLFFLDPDALIPLAKPAVVG